eukprot:UN34422
MDSTEDYIYYGNRLIEHHYLKHSTKPLIINTQGWAVGAGLPILLQFIKKCQPTHVLCLMKPWHVDNTEKSIPNVVTTNIFFLKPFEKNPPKELNKIDNKENVLTNDTINKPEKTKNV